MVTFQCQTRTVIPVVKEHHSSQRVKAYTGLSAQVPTLHFCRCVALVLYEFYISCVIYELTDAYFVRCRMNHYELLTSSSLVSHVYTLCLSYQCYRRIPAKEYYLAPSAGLEHYCCLGYIEIKSQSLSFIMRILCLR